MTDTTSLREIAAKWLQEAEGFSDGDAMARRACARELQAALSARDEAGAVACGACGKEWDGQKCGQAENGWPFPVCYPIATPPADRAPGGEVMELIAAATELRQRQREYLADPPGQRSNDRGRLVGVAADRVDAALAALAARTGKGEGR